MKKLRRKARLFGLPYRLFEMLFPFIFLHGTACMKQRFFGAQGAEGFSLPAPLTSFLDRERKRFLAFARNDDRGKAEEVKEKSVNRKMSHQKCGAFLRKR